MSFGLTRCVTFFFAVLILLAACKSASERSDNPRPAPETIISSTPPFQTKEPERYRAIRTITIGTPDGKTTVMRMLIAKDGELRRSDFSDDGTIYLETPEGRLVLLPEGNVFADLASETPIASVEDDQLSPEGFLHGDKNITSYQELGTEMIDGRNANKYRVVVNSSNGVNVSVNETLIWIDAELNMPIKSETKSAEGALITTRISEISLEVDKSIFQVPSSYEKVTFTEFQKRQKKNL